MFQVFVCGGYLYASNGVSSYLPKQFFDKEPWYVRLVLEGEDRLERNQKASEREKYVIRLGDGTLEEVDREIYLEWYRSERRERYHIGDIEIMRS